MGRLFRVQRQSAGAQLTAPQLLQKAVSLRSGYRGGTQIRTGDKGFAVLCLTTWPCRRTGTIAPGEESINRPSPPLLVLTNGHGEDVIARRVLESLLASRIDISVAVLPLVGRGDGFRGLPRLSLLGRPQQLPSGGFGNQSLMAFLQDLRAGVVGLTWEQWREVRRWARLHPHGRLLAVGDLLPLLMAWGSGRPYGFIGTPKSDYTWRTPLHCSPLADACHGIKGSEWDPWEWALMGCHRARLVAMRDRITARGLRRRGIQALAPGNPMLDGFPRQAALPPSLQGQRRLLLLCGSRMPEALDNGCRLLAVLEQAPLWAQSLLVLMATGGEPTRVALESLLHAEGFVPAPLPTEPAAEGCWRRGRHILLLGVGRFAQWACWAELGLATAGTATEQLVGLARPAVSLSGPGPQFTRGFARRQARLLGGAVHPCDSAAQAARWLALLLAEPGLRQRLGLIGRSRMGPPGGSARLAALLQERLLHD